MATLPTPISEKIYTYLQANIIHEEDILSELRLVTSKLPGSVMQISPVQAQFMRLLIQISNAKRVLELGTFTGYSALAMALALPAGGTLITCDKDAKTTELAKQFWEKANVSHKIQLLLGEATDSLDTLIEKNGHNSFDFIFIDADKSNYPIYYEKALELLRPGGTIVLDNTLLQGKVADENHQEKATQIMRTLNANIAKDTRVNACLLPMADGITLAIKK